MPKNVGSPGYEPYPRFRSATVWFPSLRPPTKYFRLLSFSHALAHPPPQPDLYVSLTPPLPQHQQSTAVSSETLSQSQMQKLTGHSTPHPPSARSPTAFLPCPPTPGRTHDHSPSRRTDTAPSLER